MLWGVERSNELVKRKIESRLLKIYVLSYIEFWRLCDIFVFKRYGIRFSFVKDKFGYDWEEKVNINRGKKVSIVFVGFLKFWVWIKGI